MLGGPPGSDYRPAGRAAHFQNTWAAEIWGGSVGSRLSGPPGLRHGCGLLLPGCQWRGICLCGNLSRASRL